MRALRGAEWPRNLRQLDAVVQRLLMDAEGEEVLTLDHCADDVGELLGIGIDDERPSSDEIRAMVVALRSKAKAARELGISRTTVYRALAEQTDVPAELSVVQEGGEEEA
jgi:transcriptional regulator of acetoin/glycerol metabolism